MELPREHALDQPLQACSTLNALTWRLFDDLSHNNVQMALQTCAHLHTMTWMLYGKLTGKPVPAQKARFCYICREMGHFGPSCPTMDQANAATNHDQYPGMTCWNCHETGHFYAQCPKKDKQRKSKADAICYNCQNKVHYAAECTQKRKQMTDEACQTDEPQPAKRAKLDQETTPIKNQPIQDTPPAPVKSLFSQASNKAIGVVFSNPKNKPTEEELMNYRPPVGNFEKASPAASNQFVKIFTEEERKQIEEARRKPQPLVNAVFGVKPYNITPPQSPLDTPDMCVDETTQDSGYLQIQ